MSISRIKKYLNKYGVENGHIENQKRPKKDNSVKGDIFLKLPLLWCFNKI